MLPVLGSPPFGSTSVPLDPEARRRSMLHQEWKRSEGQRLRSNNTAAEGARQQTQLAPTHTLSEKACDQSALGVEFLGKKTSQIGAIGEPAFKTNSGGKAVENNPPVAPHFRVIRGEGAGAPLAPGKGKRRCLPAQCSHSIASMKRRANSNRSSGTC